MTEKQELIFEEITNYYQKNKVMPSIRYLKDKFNYQSTNSIVFHLKKLEENNYLTRNEQNKLVLNDLLQNNHLVYVQTINFKQEIYLNLNRKKEYLAFMLKHNYFIKDYLLKGDILIIEKKKKVMNNDFGLFIINNKYQIMKYFYQDGFYLLQDKEQIILNKIHLIGKVIMIQRNLNNH